jgi:hypothetical protein
MNISRRIFLAGYTVFPDGTSSKGLMYGLSAARQTDPATVSAFATRSRYS